MQRPIGRPELSPDDGDLYNFLRDTASEWRFWTFADDLGLPEASKLVVTGAALARDIAIDGWNRWMNRRLGHDWFLVHQRHVLEEDYRNERRGIFLVAGSSVLVVHRCESVLATINRYERKGFAPDGSPMALGQEERVDLHCILAPPHDDTLKVLPVPVVPNVTVFNH